MDAFASALLERLFATSVQTALLTAVVWALCRFVRRLSASCQCWLWWLVALQALIGLIAAPVELPLLPQSSAAPAILPAHQPLPDWSQGIAALAGSNPSGIASADLSWKMVLLLVWLSGLVVMIRSTARDWQHSRQLLRNSMPCTDSRLCRALLRSGETSRLRRIPEIRLTPRIESPMLVGHFTPVLLLPECSSLSTEELDMALAHELSHLRRRDLLWGVAPVLMRHLFFFHPLAHLVVREYGITREAACDAAVVNGDQRSRGTYGRLLIRFGASSDSSAGLRASSPTFYSLMKRLTMLQTTHPHSRPISIAVLIVVATIGVMPLRLVASIGAAGSTKADSATTRAEAAPALVKHIPETLEDTIAESATAGANKVDPVTKTSASVGARKHFDVHAGQVTPRQERNPESLWSRSTIRSAARQKALLEMIPSLLESRGSRQEAASTGPQDLAHVQAELASRAKELVKRQTKRVSLTRLQNQLDTNPEPAPSKASVDI